MQQRLQLLSTFLLAFGASFWTADDRLGAGPSAVSPSSGARRATAEELEILSHLSIARLPHGTDPLHPGYLTLRVTGLDVQLVNGLGATNGNPSDPFATTGTTNGLGNLLIGYGEASGGSHAVQLGSSWAGSFGTLAAGQGNYVQSPYAAAVGGHESIVNRPGSVIAGGSEGETLGENAVLTGGHQNWAGGESAVVLGGRGGLAYADRCVLGGGWRNTIHPGGLDAYIAGGQDGQISGRGAAVAGGYLSNATATVGFVGGGHGNAAGGAGGTTVIGGYQNFAFEDYSTVVGGQTNTAYGVYGVVVGGVNNTVGGTYCVVVGGRDNQAGTCSGNNCDPGNTVQGGDNNRAVYVFGPIDYSSYQSISGGRDRTMNVVCSLALFGEKPIWRAGGEYRCAPPP